jgi:hypothetical protein
VRDPVGEHAHRRLVTGSEAPPLSSLPLRRWAHLAMTAGAWLASHTELDRVWLKPEPSSFFRLVGTTSQPEPS